MKYLLLLTLISSCFITTDNLLYPRITMLFSPFDKNACTTLPKKSFPDSLKDSDFVIIDRVLSVCIDKYNQEQSAEYKKMNKKISK